MQSKVLAEPLFVGREQELAELKHYLKLAKDGKGATVFVSGEAGTGKTRLINELLKWAKNKGITVLDGWCLSETAVPYFPFIEAFDAYFASVITDKQPKSLPPLAVQVGGEVLQIDEPRITAWLAGPSPTKEGGKLETFSSHVWKDQTFAAVARTLHSISTREPIILFIDDIHWADSASLALMHYLARAVNNSERVAIIATFRSEELTVDKEGHPHQLTETLRMMRREDLFTEIKLTNLNEVNVSKMAQNMIGGSLQEEFAEKLAKESKGNALFVVESLRMLTERKSLVQERDYWRLAVDEFGIPSKVKDIILRRLAVLKRSQRRVVDAASVIGEKFDLELLSKLLGLDSLEVLETLDVIADSTSLVCAEGNFYRFDHERSRKTLYDEISLPLKRGYHARIAEILESAKSKKSLFSDLAFHYAKAGNKEKAIEYSLEAGRDALEKYSSSEAISHFNYVLQVLEEEQTYAEQRDIALEGLGDAFYASNRFSDAVKSYESLANTDNGTVKMRALIKAMWATFFQGDIPHIGELVRRAEEYGDLSQLDRAHILHFKTFDFSFSGDKASTALEEALRIFEEEYALSGAAELLFLATGNEKMKKELSMCLRSIAIYEDLGDYRSQMEAYNVTGGWHFSNYALYPEALGLLEKVFEIEYKTKMGNYLMLASSYNYSAQIAGLMGDFSKAVEMGLRALEYLDKANSTLYLASIYYTLVVNYVKLGDLSNAEGYFDKMENLPTELKNHLTLYYTNIAKIVYYAGKNQREKLTKHFNEIATNLLNRKSGKFDFSVQKNYAWALEKQGKSVEAKKLRKDINTVVDGYAERVKHAHVELGLIAPINVIVRKNFEARLDIVNVSRVNCTITKIEHLVPYGLDIVAIPSKCIADEGLIKFKDKNIGPFKVNTVTVSLRASKAGTFTLNPLVTYVDDLGQTKESLTEAITVTAKPEKPKYKVLPGRIPTGNTELDSLLLGGIPEKYAVVLTGSPSDERDKLIRNFLKAATEKEITFNISTEATGLGDLLENPNFYLFLCNPKPKTEVPDLPNVYWLQGKADITNLGIALTKAYRSISQSITQKRICIEILSDVLVKHGINTTREWISGLITDLGAKGFTMLVVMNPSMHLPNEANAVLDLFDGEISITQSDDPLDCKKSILVKKLRNQSYIKNPICLMNK